MVGVFVEGGLPWTLFPTVIAWAALLIFEDTEGHAIVDKVCAPITHPIIRRWLLGWLPTCVNASPTIQSRLLLLGAIGHALDGSAPGTVMSK